MMISAYSNKGPEHAEMIEKLILENQIGGLIFFQGAPMAQAYYTNYYQQLSTIPLLIGIDGEWGLAMRLQGVNKFPFNMTLGAAGKDSLTYETGYLIGKQCKMLGIHVNFAPDVDVNTNPENPIIGFRSFGESTAQVEHSGELLMRGMQDAGIMACAKHFPGHGDSKGDSHLELPYIGHDLARLEDVELRPFANLFKAGVMSAMVAHLEIPALDTVAHRPSSMSPAIVNGLLKKEMGFQGLVFTDALNMKAISRFYGIGYAEAAAIKAGNDILLCPEDVPKAIEVILEQVNSGYLDSAEIAEHARKVLFFKMLSGLDQYKHMDLSDRDIQTWNREAESISEKVAEAAITVVTDSEYRLPLPRNTKRKIAQWSIGKSGNYIFGDAINEFQKAELFFTYRDSGYDVFAKMSDSILAHFDEAIISIHEQNLWGKKSQLLPQQLVQNIYKLADQMPVTVVVFGNVYVLKNIPNLKCVLVAYEDGEIYQKAAADILFGEKYSHGKLPAMAYKGYYLDQGVSTRENVKNIFEEKSPLIAGFQKDFTEDLDKLLAFAQKEHASPGGQMLVLKDGKAVYNRSWGSFYYDSLRPVKNTDLYDLASVTKVAATTLCLMKLYETGDIRLDAAISHYLPELKGTNKEKLTLRQLLLHESGLPAWIPFYKNAMVKPGVFVSNYDSGHTVKLADSFWMDPAFEQEVWKEIVACRLEKKGVYRYSDLGMIIAARIVEKVSGMNISQFANKYFYAPLHLQRTLFLPAGTYYESEIAPTVEDNYFRNQRVQGYVHDPASAMLGGIAGNAGLFSNSSEMAVLFEMLLNNGSVGNTKCLKENTIKEFTKKGHKKTHRGLGFDKPNALPGEKANISEIVPLALYGHSGFTGNWAWADPENNIVFIFLSNRTYPNENNKKLLELNIRTRAIEIVYSSLKK